MFDSGVGGLTIFRAIADALKQTDDPSQIVFVSDNAGFPYGTKTEYSLINRVHRVLAELIHKFEPDLVVIACNSASTVVLPSLREKFDVPFVGVVPAIKPAAALTESSSIAVIATPATVSRDYTKQLVQDFAGDKKVTLLGSSELVELAEEKIRGLSVDVKRLKLAIQPLLENEQLANIDTLVLACTHFPLLLEELKQQLPQVKHWVDSGDAIARRVLELLNSPTPNVEQPNRTNIKSIERIENSGELSHQAWLTAPDDQQENLAHFLKGLNCNHLAVMAIPD